MNDLLVDLTSQAIVAAILHGTQLRRHQRARRHSRLIAASAEDVIIRVTSAVGDVSDALRAEFDGNIPLGVETLLQSRDFQELARLRAAAYRSDLDQAAERTFRLMLRRIAALYVPTRHAPKIATVLLGVLDQALVAAHSSPESRELLSTDPESVAAHIIIRQLDCLTDFADFWKTHGRQREADLREILLRHRGQVQEGTRRISPPDFSERRLVDLGQIYVVPAMSGAHESAAGLLDRLRRREPGGVVVLGDPGAGKTTLSTYLAHRLTTGECEGDLLTVAIVPLRDFEAKRSLRPLSVAEYVAERSRERLQVGASSANWESAFRRGLVAVFFDGLDELIHVPRRVEMAEIVDSFVTAYPSVPVVVTCRYQGYSEAALPRDHFELLTLRPFTGGQISEYAHKWFGLEGNAIGELTAEDSAQLFLTESMSTDELRTNPLLLSLLCILFRGRGYIPENLSEIYKECTELLFERWDLHRQVRVARFGDRLRLLLERLAGWMYAEGLNEVGVSERALLERCESELLVLKADDPESARRAALEFVDHCRGRAWVFSDASSSDSWERRFCFTHRSFMEYFAARGLARSLQGTTSAAVEEFERLVFEVSGEFMAALTLQVLGVNSDEVLNVFVNRLTHRSKPERDVAVGFLTLVLRYVDVHERSATRICAFIVGELLDEEVPLSSSLDVITDIRGDEALTSMGEAVANLALCRSENWPAVYRFLSGIVAVPTTNIKDWDVLPAVVLDAADTFLQVSGVEVIRQVEFRAVIDDLRSQLFAYVRNAAQFENCFAGIVCTRLLPSGGVAERWCGQLLNYPLWQGDCCYVNLTRSLLIEVNYGHNYDEAFILFSECLLAAAAGASELPMGLEATTGILDEVRESFVEPIDLAALPNENYRLAAVPLPVTVALVAVLYRAAVLLGHHASRLLRASLSLTVTGGDVELAYFQGLDDLHDPFSRTASGDVQVAMEFSRRLLDAVTIQSPRSHL
jgi:hypothetical protein